MNEKNNLFKKGFLARFRGLKIRTKLIVAFLVIALIPLIGASYFVIQNANSILIEKINEQYQSEISSHLNAIDMIMWQNYNIIRSVSEGGVLTRGTSAPEEITVFLQRKKDIHGFESLSFFDINRIRIADTDGIGIGKEHLVEGFWHKVLKGEVSVGDDIKLGPERNIPIIYLAAPVKDGENNIIGVVVARFEPKQLFTALESATHHTTLLDENGRIIYTTCPVYSGKVLEKITDDLVSVKEVLAGKDGIIEEYIPSHQKEFITTFAHEKGYKNFAGNDWSILEFISKEDSLASVTVLRNKLILIIFVSALLIFIFGFLFPKIIANPIKKLIKTAQAIADGDLTIKAEINSKDEIGQLAESFNQMVENLIGSKKYTSKLIEASLDSLITLSEKGKIIDVNEEAVKAIGVSRKKIINTDFFNYFTEPDKARAMYKEVLLKGVIKNYSLVIRHKSGELTPVSCNISVYYDAEGKMKGIFATMHDTSEAKKYVATRLERVTPILRKISIGDFSQDIKIPEEEDEFTGHLVALNLMVDNLRKTVSINAKLVKELEKEKSNLEQRIKERTVNLDAANQQLKVANQQMQASNQQLSTAQKNLQDKLVELERFNKITMGRELRILELKEEVERLKSKKTN